MSAISGRKIKMKIKKTKQDKQVSCKMHYSKFMILKNMTITCLSYGISLKVYSACFNYISTLIYGVCTYNQKKMPIYL